MAPRRPVGGGGPMTQYFLVILMLFGVTTLWMNSNHGGVVDQLKNVEAFRKQHLSKGISLSRSKLAQNPSKLIAERKAARLKQQTPVQAEEPKRGHQLAGLNCDKWGGPANEFAQEMIYWSDIPSDAHHVSPYHKPDVKQFMTFEPDQGGFNNIRMSMESVLTLAAATGRTLVLPPEQGMYLLHKHEGGKQKKHFTFNDFYHMESIANEHAGLDIIHMEDFLVKMAMTGKLRDPDTGLPSFPPGNRTNWSGIPVRPLYLYLRKVTVWPWWDPEECVAAFPSDPSHLKSLRQMKENIDKSGGFSSYQKYVGKPAPVDASPEDRLREMWADRKDLCLYNETLREAPVIHFGYDYGKEGARLLVHFYAFLFFQDWQQDLWMKRFVRDHVRYVDEIQCAAARVVHALRERAKAKGTSPTGEFDAFHIRRGDFQYTVTRFEADKIYRVSKDKLVPNATVYIATDERNKTFFKPLADKYDVVYLDDMMHLLEGVNTNFYGMIDQLIASRGRTFFGCWFSTFTGYINRIRGYHANKAQKPGFEKGLIMDSFYYALEDRKYHMQEFYPVKKSFYAREFPTSWRLIDKGIEELGSAVA